ncbi:MAG TPA: MAPEG family protein [Steroidobacteraceae bacterium]|nr:MAPEG family protein [Steroidobacteraceae bacterium]
MVWVDIVGLLAVIQLVVFITLVGGARGRYGVVAPATTGHPVFERYYRVQMNTVEILLVLLPALWLAAKYWSPKYAAILGAIYLVGRVVYLVSYVRDPARRSFGYTLSSAPAIALLVGALIGAIRSALQG